MFLRDFSTGYFTMLKLQFFLCQMVWLGAFFYAGHSEEHVFILFLAGVGFFQICYLYTIHEMLKVFHVKQVQKKYGRRRKLENSDYEDEPLSDYESENDRNWY